jgi:Na+-translocating ferredoxin:NAD+ oxidoreductase RnfG subunit
MKGLILHFLFLFAAFFYLISIQLFAQEIKESTEAFINESIGEYSEIEFEKYDLSPKLRNKIETESKQRFYSDFVYIVRTRIEETITSVSILDNVMGRDQPITFAAMFDKGGNIISSDIIKYREPYGGAVQNDSWTEQFRGKSSTSGFEVGNDVDGISGATISVNSLTRGIKKLSFLYESLKDSLWISNFTISKKK